MINLKAELRQVSANANVEKQELLEKIAIEKKNAYESSMRADKSEKDLTEIFKIIEGLQKDLTSKQQECDYLRKETQDLDNALAGMRNSIDQQQKEIQQWKINNDILQERSTELDRLKIQHQNVKNDLDVKTSQLQKAERELVAFKMAKLDRNTQMSSYMTLLKSLCECDVLLWYYIENNLLALKEQGVNIYMTVTGSSNAKWIGIIEKCKILPEYDEKIYKENVLKFIICYREQRLAFLDLIDSWIKLDNKTNMQRIVSDSVKLDAQNLKVNISKMTNLLKKLEKKISIGTVPNTIEISFRREIDELRQRAPVS